MIKTAVGILALNKYTVINYLQRQFSAASIFFVITPWYDAI
jgi:hypothetical protein